MPPSPLTRCFACLAVLAFPGVFLWLEDGNGTVAMVLLGIALSLWVAAAWLLVHDAPAFDDRAGHRTRPGGEARAFRRTTLVLSGSAAAVAAMALARGWCCNLGWRTAAGAAVLVFLLLAMFGTAVATGFTLASRRAGGRRLVALVLLVPPLAGGMWSQETTRIPPGLGFVQASTTGLTVAVAVAAPGYLLAWWLAACRKRWLPALALAGLSGAALPLLHGSGFVLAREPRPLPDATVTISRRPPPPQVETVTSNRPGAGAFAERFVSIEGRFEVGGLRDDEFVSFVSLFADAPGGGVAQGHKYRGGWGWGGNERGILRNTPTAAPAARRDLLEHLAGRIPGRPRLVLEPEDEWSANWVNLRSPTESLEHRAWHIDGSVMRLEDGGGFVVGNGGWRRLPAGGIVRVWPALSNAYGVTTRIRIVLPDRDGMLRAATAGGDRFSHFAIPGDRPRVFLVDPAGRTATLPHVNGTFVAGRGLGSHWEEWSVNLLYINGPRGHDPATEQAVADLLRSRLHVFTARPVARVRAVLPPAG